ncbi:MAG: alpha-amylase family glycosyl hydrolase [Anaerolineales bacterium]
MFTKHRYLIALGLIAMLFSSCGTPPPPAGPMPTALPATATPVPPTKTPAPSPTATIPPTATPVPPTETPLPAPTLSNPAEAREPVAVSPVGLDGTLPTGADGQPWWNDVVFYEIFVRSFYDSDGDGVGDLPGLIEKLDYLNDGDPTTTDDLGVTGLWLMPVHQSPSYHGYDVVDYYQIDDEYGTNEDFLRLMEEAHARGIYVIIDLVLNHTSAQHPWFLESQDPDSEKRDWYLWADEPGRQGWHKGESGYYYGIFWDQMPDLNYENPEVTAEMQEIIRFWLEDMGVDGFRLDAIKHIVEEGDELENTPANHAWLESFYEFYKSVRADAFTVGEVWSSSREVVEYVGDEVDIAFEFDLADAFVSAAFRGRRTSAALAQSTVIDLYPDGQFATFLANHDQTRVRSRLLNDEQAKLAATLQLTFPGVPFIYYGEEIGMQGAKPDENIRRPMQWTADGGFTTGAPWRGYYEDVAERNVAAQTDDPDALLNHYRALIHLRNTHEALRIGAWTPIESHHSGVYAALRTSDEETLLVIANLKGEPIVDYALDLEEGPLAAGVQPTLLLGEGRLNAPIVAETGGFTGYAPLPVLESYQSYIIQFLP